MMKDHLFHFTKTINGESVRYPHSSIRVFINRMAKIIIVQKSKPR